MALYIQNKKVEKLVGELAFLTGETKTEAITKALEIRLIQVRQSLKRRNSASRLDKIAQHCAALPVIKTQAVESLLYDKRGLPT
jgi:antitoxin VapB